MLGKRRYNIPSRLLKKLDMSYRSGNSNVCERVVVSIDGLIGAGKSCALRKFRSVFYEKCSTDDELDCLFYPDIDIMEEPVEQFAKYSEGLNPLFLSYKDPVKNLPFAQLHIQKCVARDFKKNFDLQEAKSAAINRAAKKNKPDPAQKKRWKLFICERSPEACKVFARTHFELGNISELTFVKLSEELSNDIQKIPKPDLYLDITDTAEDCLGRIKNRSRQGEEFIKLDFLKELEKQYQQHYLKVQFKDKAKVVKIDTKGTEAGARATPEQIVERCLEEIKHFVQLKQRSGRDTFTYSSSSSSSDDDIWS